MANYRLVSNAQFRPFSFEEYVKPYQMYGEAYKEIELNIIDLETLAGKWDKLANELTDPKTHATYKAYADELRALANLLSRYGMSPQLRRRAATMRGRYAQEIEPIELLYNKRELLRQEQHQLNVANNGNLRFDNDFRNMSLDDMMDNPNMSYLFVSGDKITQDVAAMVLAYANDKGDLLEFDKVEGGEKNKRGEDVYIQLKKRKGFTLEDAEKAINGDPNADPYLLSIVLKVLDMYKDNPAYDETWAAPYIAKGIRTGVMGVEANAMQNVNVFTNPELEKFEFDKEIGWYNAKTSRISANASALNAATNAKMTDYLIKADKLKHEAYGLIWDNKTNNFRPMTDAEKRRSSIYLASLNTAANKAALSLGNNLGGYAAIAANQKAVPQSTQKGSVVLKVYTPELIRSEVNNGAGVYTYDEEGSTSRFGSLAPHAKVVVRLQLQHLGSAYKPENFIYIVPKHKNGEAATAILVPIEKAPDVLK